MLDNNKKSNGTNINNNISKNENTQIFRGAKNATEAIIKFVEKVDGEINACLDSTGPSVMLGVESIKNARLDAKKRGVRLRYVTEITTDNINYCKEMMKLF